MASDWIWSAEKTSVVVPSVSAIAVYTNPQGEVVVRQESPMGDDDSFIIIPRAMAAKVAKAIQAEAKKPFTPDEE